MAPWNPLVLEGSVLVRNIAHNGIKDVSIRFTLDDWKTTSEIPCHYGVSLPSVPPWFGMPSAVADFGERPTDSAEKWDEVVQTSAHRGFLHEVREWKRCRACGIFNAHRFEDEVQPPSLALRHSKRGSLHRAAFVSPSCPLWDGGLRCPTMYPSIDFSKKTHFGI